MARPIRPLVQIFSLLLILGVPLGAQTADSGFTFSCASWEWLDGAPINYLAGKPKRNETAEGKLERLAEVDIPEMTRSVSYAFQGGRQIGFYRTKTNVDGKVMLQTVASAKVPEGWSRVLFVFFPGKDPGTYRIYPIRDDRVHAPYGSYQFVNLSQHTLSGILDREPIALKPMGRSIIKLRGGESRPLNFGVWTTIDGRRKWLQRNTLTYKPSKYLIYFFYANEDQQGRLKMKSKGIVDFRPPPAPDGDAVTPVDGGDDS